MQTLPMLSSTAFLTGVFLFVWVLALRSWRHRTKSPQTEWVDTCDGRMTFDSAGMTISKAAETVSIPWGDLVKIELTWAENPFPDPLFGRYCDTDWLLWSQRDYPLVLSESANDAHAKALLGAFAKHLPAFDFDYATFQQNQYKRLHDYDGGRVLVWQKHMG